MSGVFGIIDTPPPLHPASVSSPRGEGGGVNILEDARHWIGLFQYIPLRWWVWVPIEEKDLEPKSPGLPKHVLELSGWSLLKSFENLDFIKPHLLFFYINYHLCVISFRSFEKGIKKHIYS